MENSLTQSAEPRICEECNSDQLILDWESGELVCQSCGFVISSPMVDQGPEWRAFDYVQSNTLPRVGSPVTWSIHDKGLSSQMGWQDKDHSGRSLTPQERAKHYRLRRWDRRSKVSDSMDRNLAQALSSITAICNKLNLPESIVETASMIYRNALKRKLIRGRSIQSIAVASVYMACRQCGVIRSLEEIASASNIPKKEAARNYRFLLKELNPKVPLAMPSSHIGKIVNKLRLNGDAEFLAAQVLSRASEMKLTVGRSPSGMAAACIYIGTILTGDRVTQSEIAREAQVTEVTIRNRYKELSRNLHFTVSL